MRNFVSFSILIFSFHFIFGINNEYLIDMVLIVVFWFLVNRLTLRYNKSSSNGFLEYLNPNIKGIIIFISFLMMVYKLQFISLNLSDFLEFYLPLELSTLLLFYILTKYFIHNESVSNVLENGIIFKEISEDIKIDTDKIIKTETLLNGKKEKALETLHSYSEINYRLSSFDQSVNYGELQHILIYDNLINNVKNIDTLLMRLYENLMNGGIVITFYQKLESRYSGKISYLDYFFHGIFPTLPFLKNIYKFLSRGKNRILSTSEMWGRLHRAGFSVEKEICLKDCFMLISKKQYKPIFDVKPSYSPLITLDRVSLGGSLITIHKIRSMYPYSEFNQKKLFELNSLDSSGKFNDDFRITPFGNFIRKFWIDEIPQFIDWLRGDIKIVGIRAMSQQYFSLYPVRYQKKYFKVKPGFVSPIFDDKDTKFVDIVNTEEKYLDYYLERPLLTDIQYFFLTIFGILRGQRSS